MPGPAYAPIIGDTLVKNNSLYCVLDLITSISSVALSIASACMTDIYTSPTNDLPYKYLINLSLTFFAVLGLPNKFILPLLNSKTGLIPIILEPK